MCNLVNSTSIFRRARTVGTAALLAFAACTAGFLSPAPVEAAMWGGTNDLNHVGYETTMWSYADPFGFTTLSNSLQLAEHSSTNHGPRITALEIGLFNAQSSNAATSNRMELAVSGAASVASSANVATSNRMVEVTTAVSNRMEAAVASLALGGEAVSNLAVQASSAALSNAQNIAAMLTTGKVDIVWDSTRSNVFWRLSGGDTISSYQVTNWYAFVEPPQWTLTTDSGFGFKYLAETNMLADYTTTFPFTNGNFLGYFSHDPPYEIANIEYDHQNGGWEDTTWESQPPYPPASAVLAGYDVGYYGTAYLSRVTTYLGTTNVLLQSWALGNGGSSSWEAVSNDVTQAAFSWSSVSNQITLLSLSWSEVSNSVMTGADLGLTSIQPSDAANLLSATGMSSVASGILVYTNVAYGGKYPHSVCGDGTNLFLSDLNQPPTIYKFNVLTGALDLVATTNIPLAGGVVQALWDGPRRSVWLGVYGPGSTPGLYRLDADTMDITRVTTNQSFTMRYDQNMAMCQDDQYVYNGAYSTTSKHKTRYNKDTGEWTTAILGLSAHTSVIIPDLDVIVFANRQGITCVDRTAWTLAGTNYHHSGYYGKLVADDSAWFEDDTGIYAAIGFEESDTLLFAKVGTRTNGVAYRASLPELTYVSLPETSGIIYGIFGGGPKTVSYPDRYSGKLYSPPLYVCRGGELVQVDVHPDGSKSMTYRDTGTGPVNEYLQDYSGTRWVTTYSSAPHIMRVGFDETLDADTRDIESPLFMPYQIYGYYNTNQTIAVAASAASTAAAPKLDRLSGTAANLTLSGGTYCDTNSTPSFMRGIFGWDAVNQTFSFGLGDGVVGQAFLESFIPVVNQSGETITNGQVVCYGGGIGNSGQAKAVKFIADGTIRNACIFGLATHDMVNGAAGKVTDKGWVRGIPTDGAMYGEVWTNGAIVYTSTNNPGGLTMYEPNAPQHRNIIGQVINAHANNGTIQVHISRGMNLVDLDDVDGTPLTATGQFPMWDNTRKVFDFNANITTITSALMVTTFTNGTKMADGVLNGTNGFFFVPPGSTNRYWILGGN